MKSIFKVQMTGISLLLCVALNTNFSYGQKKTEKSRPIPADIISILQPFCYSCHGAGGGRLPRSKVNFAIWNGYTSGKQVEKAASICSSMKKGTMPTKLWNQQNPGLRLTREQINIVCQWADSVRLLTEKNGHRLTGKKQKSGI